jgi:hypothetical protein
MKRTLITMLAVLVATATLGLSHVQPARADQAAVTRNIILGAAALAAGVIISQNVAHKHALANAIAGYTPDGATVYQDGRVVYPNGNFYYPGNNGQSLACQGNSCQVIGNGALASGYGGYYQWNGNGWARRAAYRHDNGKHNGSYKHKDHGQGHDRGNHGEGHGRGD